MHIQLLLLRYNVDLLTGLVHIFLSGLVQYSSPDILSAATRC